MNEEIKENGSTESENEIEEYEFSWRKLCCWITLLMSVMVPVAAIGLGIICIAKAEDEEKNEVCIVSAIGIVIAAFSVIFDFVLQISLL